MSSFAKKLSARDKRRIAKNKAIREHQMVKKTISKTSGRKQVSLVLYEFGSWDVM